MAASPNRSDRRHSAPRPSRRDVVTKPPGPDIGKSIADLARLRRDKCCNCAPSRRDGASNGQARQAQCARTRSRQLRRGCAAVVFAKLVAFPHFTLLDSKVRRKALYVQVSRWTGYSDRGQRWTLRIGPTLTLPQLLDDDRHFPDLDGPQLFPTFPRFSHG
jgi:hypothetical protein